MAAASGQTYRQLLLGANRFANPNPTLLDLLLACGLRVGLDVKVREEHNQREDIEMHRKQGKQLAIRLARHTSVVLHDVHRYGAQDAHKELNDLARCDEGLACRRHNQLLGLDQGTQSTLRRRYGYFR